MATAQRNTLTVTPPSALLSDFPCFDCLSEHELNAVIFLGFATYLDLTVAELLEASKCFTCLSKKQRLRIIAEVIGNEYLTAAQMADIREAIKCLRCATPAQLEAGYVYGMASAYNPTET